MEASSCSVLIFSDAASTWAWVAKGPTRTRIWRVLDLSSFITDGNPASSSLAWALAAFSGTANSPTLMKKDLVSAAGLDAAAVVFCTGVAAAAAVCVFLVAFVFSGSLAAST